jgi:hypothetical protein
VRSHPEVVTDTAEGADGATVLAAYFDPNCFARHGPAVTGRVTISLPIGDTLR